MQLKYNSYAFNSHTTTLPISRTFEHDQRGVAVRERQEWNVKTVITGTSQSDLTTKIIALTGAMVDGGSLIFYRDDTGLSAHYLYNVKIQSINFPTSDGVEYATQRTVEIRFSGTKIIGESNQVIRFNESVSTTGTGGGRFVMKETIEGKPVRQQVAQYTLCTATQSGSATSLAVPAPPAPLWQELEHVDQRRVDYTSNTQEDGSVEHSVSWSYSFSSDTAFNGSPNEWL